LTTTNQPDPLPHSVQPQDDSNPLFPIVSRQELLSAEDKLILYMSLQDIAEELRRIRRERQKNQQIR
jgi:hypothetical protein